MMGKTVYRTIYCLTGKIETRQTEGACSLKAPPTTAPPPPPRESSPVTTAFLETPR